MHHDVDGLDQQGIWSYSGFLNAITFITIPYYTFHEANKCRYLFHGSDMTEAVIRACDPISALTAQSALSEGILDIMSCVTFFSMATDEHLNVSMQRTCLAFSILN